MLLNQYTLKVTDFDEQAEGYSKRNALFLGEATLMAIGACVIGAILGVSLTEAINSADIQYQVGGLNRTVPFTLAHSPAIYINAAAIMTSVSIIAALVAIVSRLRFSVADNLKSH